jgi:hypothetical protein
MRRGGTPIARASAVCDNSIGFKDSSARISPGCGLGRSFVLRISAPIVGSVGCNRPGTTNHCRELSTKAMEKHMVAPVMIKEHMEVLGSDGVHVGTVDHLEGRDQVKLAKDDPDAGGEHHFIPLAWVDHVDSMVHLKQSGAEAKARWKTH